MSFKLFFFYKIEKNKKESYVYYNLMLLKLTYVLKYEKRLFDTLS